MTMFIFGISLIGFHVGSALYDSLLLDVSTPETRSRVSGMGVAIGYVDLSSDWASAPSSWEWGEGILLCSAPWRSVLRFFPSPLSS